MSDFTVNQAKSVTRFNKIKLLLKITCGKRFGRNVDG